MRWIWILVACAGCRSCTYDPDAPSADLAQLFPEPEELSDQVWNVGDYRVHERVVLDYGLQDNTFARSYRVYDDGVWRPLGNVHDEENVGIRESASPLVVDGRLFVFVGASTFTWMPGTEAKRISPYDAHDFERCAINGHYDLRAGSVEIDGSSWKIGYTPDVVLVSEDAGVTWSVDC